MAAKTYDMVFDKAKREAGKSDAAEGCDGCGEGKGATEADSRPGTSASLPSMPTHRRPMTPADGRPFSTALRQLEKEQRVKVC